MTVSSSASGSQLGRPVGAHGEQTRQRIIAAAMRCVAEVGYSQATIREIARAADMTSGSLYHYFPNKSELLNATGEEIEQIVLPRLRAAAAQSDDVVDRLDAVLDESTRLIHDYPYLAAFLRAVRIESNARSSRGGPKYPGSKALRDVVSEIVADAHGQGALSPDTGPTGAVEAICALTRGLSEQAASLAPEAYEATLGSAKRLIRGTLFTGASHPVSGQ
ncbi:MAG: TetR/AcrR family transcriptional regulator [Mycobacterium pseudokansasii]|uniref:HTH-type transcriptional regulator SrpR n=1 Tax=Mycobacterium pseudokansasii TaxID=2341080 RepID=A0A498QI68_9MYCO|nr:TetR/AcrR family transcriptional regulator [Mycobacterium pseudokansasii]KZS65689.1 TetR family transcriptional regulator [Mycobacterium kansasii]MBY0387061.1 TetR/AcrR family transcriptional regulator [Mycobacterium pseudokansasii]VAZ87545.1 HTH-type transcriptional regulator SrpR [Mycobacterium pseudokansasii]VAZ87926.1 HTH-type transcriptional regulator SrpR [Mycobacterium pseudokansasii]VBA45807.1 HTH-type transcriptional regulator SrpR [Mycobacterium pseudokansasii]